jgi:hypothetical protein
MRPQVMNGEIDRCCYLVILKMRANSECHRRVDKGRRHASVQYSVWLPKVVAHIDLYVRLTDTNISQLHPDQPGERKAIQSVSGTFLIFFGDLSRGHRCEFDKTFGVFEV